MLEIEAKTIPHSEQRYPTCGDYWETNGKINFRVSDLGDTNQEFLIFIHEMIEAILCKHNGISFAEIDTYDKTYEAMRKPGDMSEPGDDVNAPYYRQHQFAMNIERMLALELGINWDEYNDKVEQL